MTWWCYYIIVVTLKRYIYYLNLDGFIHLLFPAVTPSVANRGDGHLASLLFLMLHEDT